MIIHSVPRGISDTELISAIQRVFLDATDQASWLKPGDTVLLKPALNSPNPYPATTHPLSIHAIKDLLVQRGAHVVIGDQSGIEHVVHSPKGVIKGSSIKNFETAGILRNPSDRKSFVAFEADVWDSFEHIQTNRTLSWKNGFYVTPWIKKADHIINLPRVSAHAQAGVTLGFKNLVGILREDSRIEFHTNGPFNSFITKAAQGSELSIHDDGTRAFIEKITEISLAVKDKLRATLFTATQAQTTLGPDREILPGLRSHVATPETGLVFASTNPVAAEAFAISYLGYLYQTCTPGSAKLFQKMIVSANGRIKEPGTYPVVEHPFIAHAVQLGLGNPREEMKWIGEDKGLVEGLRY